MRAFYLFSSFFEAFLNTTTNHSEIAFFKLFKLFACKPELAGSEYYKTSHHLRVREGEYARKIENYDSGAARDSDAGNASALEEFDLDWRSSTSTGKVRPRLQGFDLNLMKLKEDSFEPKNSIEIPRNLEIQG